MGLPEEFENQFQAFIGGNKDTAVVNTPESGDIAPPVSEVMPPVVDTPTAVETQATPTPETKTEITQPDYNKFLEESSNGLFKSVEDFKSSLTKVTEYENILKERDDLKVKAEVNPFANDLVRQFNELSKKGANSNQIDAFLKINQIGELSQLDPFQVKLNKLVLVDGVSPATAERMITKEFGLNIDVDEELLTNEEKAERKIQLEDAKETLRLSSKTDLEQLQQYKAKLTETPAVPDPKDAELQRQAMVKAHVDLVKPVAQQLAPLLNGLGTVAFGEGDKADKLDFNFDDAFKAKIPTLVESYLTSDIAPVTEDKIREAAEYVTSAYKIEHYERDLKTAFEHGLNLGQERKASEYHNQNGLHTPAANTPQDVDAHYRQLSAIATGQDN